MSVRSGGAGWGAAVVVVVTGAGVGTTWAAVLTAVTAVVTGT